MLDPKGDMGNLMLAFPELSAASFRPWVNEDDARSEGLSLDDFAAKTAVVWKKASRQAGSARSALQHCALQPTSWPTRRDPQPVSR